MDGEGEKPFICHRRRCQAAFDAAVCAACVAGDRALPGLCAALLLAEIALRELWKAWRGFKPFQNAVLDCIRRSLCAAAAALAGQAEADCAGLLLGMAAAAAARVLLERFRPPWLTGWRVYRRILRLQALSLQLRTVDPVQKESRDCHVYSFTDGGKSAIMKRDSS